MKLRTKFGAFVAAAAVACAIGVAPAQAGSIQSLPSPGDLSGLCAKTTNAKLGALCSKGVEAYNACSTQTSSKGLAACLSSAAKGILGSGVPVKANKADLIAKLKSLAGGKLSGLNLQGINLSSLLGKLGGTGGLNLSGLLSKFGR